MKGAIGATLAIVLLFVGLAVGTFVPQIHQTYTTETRTVLAETTLTESDTVHTTQTLLEHRTATRTETVAETKTLAPVTVRQTATTTYHQTIRSTVVVTVPPEEPIVILDVTGYTRRDYAYVEGVVQNQDSVRHEFIKVTIAWYDADMNLMYTDYTYTMPSELDPGEKATFKTMTEVHEDVDYYEIISIEYD